MPERIFQSKFLRTLQERGYVHQSTDAAELDRLLAKGEIEGTPVAAYIGFDCTAPSLHVGSLLQIMALRWLQKCGHKPIVLMGGATTKIGDPTFKDSARPALSDAQIAANMAGIRTVFDTYLTFGSGATDAVMVNNADWIEKVGYLDLLRDYGRHFSVNRMLKMDSVKTRLEREQELSFLEFNYLILQSYDFLELNRRFQCRLQLGGSDQWSNILGGVDLLASLMVEGKTLSSVAATRELASQDKDGTVSKSDASLNFAQSILPVGANLVSFASTRTATEHDLTAYYYDKLFGLTTPLLATADGAKMGKTAQGAVWLNADACSPYDFWQYWRNVADADVPRFLKLFTELPVGEIDALTARGTDVNEAKKRLATEVTGLAHGWEAAERAAESARQTFEQGNSTHAALPEIQLPGALLSGGLPAYELFFQAGLAASKSEARKLIRGGGAKVDGVAVVDENAMLRLETDTSWVLSAGKKQHRRVRAGA